MAQKKGERHSLAKLTEKEVREIYLRALSDESCVSIQKDYPHVKSNTIRAVASGRGWKHLGLPKRDRTHIKLKNLSRGNPKYMKNKPE